jgi:hypothetical protein
MTTDKEDHRDGPDDAVSAGDQEAAKGNLGVLGVIVDRLESDPEECWLALEGLASLELESRLAILDALSKHDRSPAARTLFRLMSTGRDRVMRQAAQVALSRTVDTPSGHHVNEGSLPAVAASSRLTPARASRTAGDVPSRNLATIIERPRLLCCLVTPLDGQGRGSIVISSGAISQRRTAAFLCDVDRGICDAMGSVERESPDAGSLLDEIDSQTGADGVRDVSELALGLLAGCLTLSGPELPHAVRDWLDGTLGPSFQPSAFPATIAGLDTSSISAAEMPRRVDALFERCPSWVDSSPLTFDLAEEIFLRQGRPSADPVRDAGAYRYLFEHCLSHRLELYRRMLLWMAWLWKCSAQPELSVSALALQSQLSDEQYAVPSHPFMVGLTTRSLMAAQHFFGTSVE